MAGCNRCEDFNYQGEEEEETSLGKKYGGLVPKKKPLISKSNERAFFDSADWALGKVFLTPTHLAIVMEYAAGGEFFERICNAGRFSEDEARFFFQQLISGVSYCHSMV